MITIDELKAKLEKNSRLLGLDLGSKRIGVSICDNKRKIATPLKTIHSSSIKILIEELAGIVQENQIFGIIIGNPINMDGTYGSSAQSINDKSKIIKKALNIYTCLWDERLSTAGAFNISSQLDIKFTEKKKKIDENAATFILQGALDYLNN